MLFKLTLYQESLISCRVAQVRQVGADLVRAPGQGVADHEAVPLRSLLFLFLLFLYMFGFWTLGSTFKGR